MPYVYLSLTSPFNLVLKYENAEIYCNINEIRQYFFETVDNCGESVY